MMRSDSLSVAWYYYSSSVADWCLFDSTVANNPFCHHQCHHLHCLWRHNHADHFRWSLDRKSSCCCCPTRICCSDGNRRIFRLHQLDNHCSHHNALERKRDTKKRVSILVQKINDPNRIIVSGYSLVECIGDFCNGTIRLGKVYGHIGLYPEKKRKYEGKKISVL